MKTNSTMNNMRGFTLVELMVVILLTAIAVIAIYRGYTAFSSSADAQEQIIELQQNLRIGMYWLEKDIRRAGMNEEDDENAGFVTADADAVEFTMDLGGTDRLVDDETWAPNDPGDGGLTDDDERLSYTLTDIDGDGRKELVKTDENNGGDLSASPPIPDDPLDNVIITNVDALNFIYLDEDRNTPVANLADIRLVQACLVVRTTNEDLRYTNNEPYENINPNGPEVILPPQGDHFRRRVSCKEIKIRNAGL